MIKEIHGDLIKEGLSGNFDVIGHCTNCFSIMGGGIAVPMAKTFGCDKFKMEAKEFVGNIDKLGTIDYEFKNLFGIKRLAVVNMYAQFGLGGKFGNSKYGIPFDYDAFTKCLIEMNKAFKGQHIGLPKFIGAGLAGGDWNIILQLIETELKDCDVTIVYLAKKI